MFASDSPVMNFEYESCNNKDVMGESALVDGEVGT
jgi:hypothetical protein